jgi:predicted nuclease of restriction endonuclease-like RecB superfamily
MLTGPHLRVRVQKKTLRPSFVKLDQHRARAQDLIALYNQAVALRWTRQRIDAEVGDVIGDAVDHKLTKGLSKLIADNSKFCSEPPIAPAEIRARLFGGVDGAPSRAGAVAAYAALGEELGLTPSELRRMLYSDRKEEQEISATQVSDPDWLLQRYNVALVQATLLRCESLEVHLDNPSSERLRQLFRNIQFHGLMSRCEPTDQGYLLILDGPTSLLKLSTRYGMGLANWFPALLLFDQPWRLEATIRWGKRGLRKQMLLDSTMGLRSHYRDTGAYVSRIEEWFETRFEALESGWTLSRQAPPIQLGGEAIIVPTYRIEKDGRVAYLDIVGFWRKKWLKKRMKLLTTHGPSNLVVAVSSKMEGAKEGLSKGLGGVVSFKEVVPAKDVLERVEACAERLG